MTIPWPSPNRVPSGRTTDQYVPVLVVLTPSSVPCAWNEVSIFGPPPGFGSTRCEVTLPASPPSFSPSIDSSLPSHVLLGPLCATQTCASQPCIIPPALAGRHDDEDVICLRRCVVNTPNPEMQAERVVREGGCRK